MRLLRVQVRVAVVEEALGLSVVVEVDVDELEEDEELELDDDQTDVMGAGTLEVINEVAGMAMLLLAHALLDGVEEIPSEE